MKYVALFRGINVGGKAKVPMLQLKEMFEGLGLANVVTYINSGNVLFEDDRKVLELEPLIEKAFAKEFGFPVRIVLRTAASIAKICREIPDDWTNDGEQKTDVMFLWPEIDNKDVLNKVVINPELENVRYIEGALVWNIGRENVTRGGGVKLIKTNLYPLMTIRNINTVRKLNELLNS